MTTIENQAPVVRERTRLPFIINAGMILLTAVMLVLFAGSVFGPTFKAAMADATSAKPELASGGYSALAMKQNIWKVISAYDNALGCAAPASTAIAVIQEPDQSGSWKEAWTVNACGQIQIFNVQFAHDSSNNLTFSISK